jgi:hypothetical protein
LSEDPLWTTSGFKALEEFIFGFMGADTDRGAERLRLKLETPLGVGVALLAACDSQLTAEAFKAEGDLKALEDVQKQLQRFEEAMRNGAILQRQRTLAVVSTPYVSVSSILDLRRILYRWQQCLPIRMLNDFIVMCRLKQRRDVPASSLIPFCGYPTLKRL